MKAWITADGVLHIKSESELERYALRTWAQDQPAEPFSHVDIEVSWPETEVEESNP